MHESIDAKRIVLPSTENSDNSILKRRYNCYIDANMYVNVLVASEPKIKDDLWYGSLIKHIKGVENNGEKNIKKIDGKNV